MEPLQINNERERQYELAREHRQKELEIVITDVIRKWLGREPILVEQLVEAIMGIDESK